MEVSEFAPAKINLTLHVTGRQAEGYHLLDSLVVFCGAGDRVTVEGDAREGLVVTGPFAEDVPCGPENLVLRAAATMGSTGLRFHLEKNLPAASGIGGGSSDAAATLRAIARLAGQALPDPARVLELGADVPVCLAARPARMQGVGEVLSTVPPLPEAWLVLVNPRVEVSTASAFRRLEQAKHPPMPRELPSWPDLDALARWLADQRNDLQGAAATLAPPIADALVAISARPGCLLARMSGSGATCFGLFRTASEAEAAATAIAAARPEWWATAAQILS